MGDGVENPAEKDSDSVSDIIIYFGVCRAALALPRSPEKQS